MIVQRITMRVRPGRMKQWVETMQQNLAKAPNPEFSRIYTCRFGPALTFVQDLEFEDLAAQQAFWKEWTKTPEHVAIVEAFRECVEKEISSEIWDVR